MALPGLGHCTVTRGFIVSCPRFYKVPFQNFPQIDQSDGAIGPLLFRFLLKLGCYTYPVNVVFPTIFEVDFSLSPFLPKGPFYL